MTITEVRPDGQETYVARGWLRASQRKLDRKLSSVTRPFQTHVQSNTQLLTPGSPALARVEVFPFNHVFRAGSAIRIIVDTPSQTGNWIFALRPTVGRNTILHDADHPSRLVVPLLPAGRAGAPLPACDSLLNQPCRAGAHPVPSGRLQLASGSPSPPRSRPERDDDVDDQAERGSPARVRDELRGASVGDGDPLSRETAGV